MNLRDLKYLVAVAEHRHFGRAAEACFVSQPTLSTQLKKLEETLGVTLIERSNRQVMLAPEGEKIVEQAQRILIEVNLLTAMSEQIREPMGGELRLGVIPTIAPYLLPKILGPLGADYPKLKINLTEGQTDQILRMLKQGELDAVILALPLNEDNIEEFELYTEPFLLAVSSDHPKAKSAQADAEDLKGEEVLLLEDGHCLRDQALAICQANSGVESNNYSATSLETLRQLVSAGLGITLMPKLAVDKSGESASNVIYIPFSDQSISRKVGLCWRKSSTREELLSQFSLSLGNYLRL
ncbi:MAG: DNA-binding transcriptional regulator OxyR [Gammaproteobacteria bacterium]|nr:DNA-binding transcriptional regulator OxyR [Gammaproteobacteria bacterium]